MAHEKRRKEEVRKWDRESSKASEEEDLGILKRAEKPVKNKRRESLSKRRGNPLTGEGASLG